MQANGSVIVELKDANGTVLGSKVIAKENVAKVTKVCQILIWKLSNVAGNTVDCKEVGWNHVMSLTVARLDGMLLKNTTR